MASEDEVEKIISILCAAYPSTPLKPETIEVYAVMFAQTPVEALKLATRLCIARCKFFPTVAEINEALKSLTDHVAPPPSAMDAWGLVWAEIQRIGSYGKPEFSDPVIAKVVSGMGWRSLCWSENAMADRAHFIKAYEIEVRRVDAAQQIAALPGAAEVNQIIGSVTKKLSAPKGVKA